MAINIKFTKFDNTSWGFRLAGGSDFPQPLTVIRVNEGGLAECMGLKVGDIVVRLNDQPIGSLTHGQVHEALKHAGNNFVLGIQREEETRKAAEVILEDNIVSYKIALADLPPVFPEEILKEETVIERHEEEKNVERTEQLSVEEEVKREEVKLAEEKPVDANSEIVSNKNLTDDEIAQLILEEEELLSDQGLLGVNFKKLRPRVSILKGSKVLEELQNIATAEPKQVRELKRTSTFLQKPQRPVPKPKREQTVEEEDGETYKIVIRKQDKKTVIARLVEKGLLPPGSEVTFARTTTSELSEPLELSEVKMHETENSPGDCLPLVSDSNSSCSIFPFDDAISFSHCSKFESSEKTLSENQPARCASYKCKSKLFREAKPSHYRKYSCTGKCDIKIKSSVKGYYLENILRGCVRSYAPRYQQIDNQLDEIAETKEDACPKKYDWLKSIGFGGGLLSNEKKKTTRRCARAHYAERIFLQNVNTVARHFRSMSKTTRISRTNRCRTKGRYMTTYLERESVRLMSLITMLFQFLLQKPDVSESMNMLKVRKQHMSYKGRYFEHVFQKNVTPVIQTVEETSISVDKQKDGPKSNRTKGRYMEKYLYRLNLRFRFALTNVFHYIKSSLDNIFSIDTLSKVRRGRLRGRYFERFVHRNVEIFELFANYVCSRISEWFEKTPLCTSQKEFSVVTLGASNYIVDNSVLNKVNEDARDKKIFEWYEDGSSCSSQKESFAVVSIDNSISNEENIDKNDDSISEEVELPKPTTDALVENDSVSKFLQSAEDYISSEVFHRGNRRLSSRSRKSIDIVPKEDDKAFSRFLQSTEDYISSEVFHRGNRRLSRSRKSIDIVPKEDDNAFSRFLQSTEDYISNEVFHRGSKRLSKSRKSIDVFSDKEDEKTLSKLLHSAEDYISTEVFHRGSRRFSKSSGKESISLVALALWDSLKSAHLNLPWFSLRIVDKSAKYDKVCDKKIDADIEFDNRRLSFVPTILYKGITNRIGVDFTRLMAYAFVPCTSLILLYMYR